MNMQNKDKHTSKSSSNEYVKKYWWKLFETRATLDALSHPDQYMGQVTIHETAAVLLPGFAINW